MVMVAALVLLAYANTFDAPFHFDDLPHIVDNPRVAEWKFSDSRMLGFASFALNYKLHGLDVFGYHVVNLAIHILNALLVYYLVFSTFETPGLKTSQLAPRAAPIACFTSLLFALHPLQTQAVTYIIQRFASLATCFYLLALVCYVRSRLQQRFSAGSALLYGACLLAAVAAMRTKEIAFTLPMITALYEAVFFSGAFKPRLLRLAPLLLTLLVIPLTLIDTGKLVGGMGRLLAPGEVEHRLKSAPPSMDSFIDDISSVTRDASRLSRHDYLMTQLRVIVTYLRLLVWPADQNLDYDYPVYQSFFHLPVIGSFGLLLLLSGVAGALLYRAVHAAPGADSGPSRIIAFGLLWFFITLAVESSLIPLLDVIFEHRLYLPSVGFVLAVVATVFGLGLKVPSPWVRTAGIVVLAGASLIFSVLTYQRNLVWQSSVALWQDVVNKSPHKIRGHNNLGNAYLSAGQADLAIEQFQIALSLKPDLLRPDHQAYFGEVHYNLARASRSRGLDQQALEHYRMAVVLKPDNVDAFNNMGAIYFKQGSIDKAIAFYQKTLKMNPAYANAHFNLGEAYAAQGQIDQAIAHYQTFLSLRPDFAQAHHNLGLAYLAKGLAEKANLHLRRAASLEAGR